MAFQPQTPEFDRPEATFPNGKEPLQVRIPAIEKRRFKAWAAQLGIEPNELFIEVWRHYERTKAGQLSQRIPNPQQEAVIDDFQKTIGTKKFGTILADPPWRFLNRTGKIAPEHRRLARYGTMRTDEICALPIGECVKPTAHLYLWVPNALLPEGLQVMKAWGFGYKANIVWHKLRKDGGSDGRGVGFYFRNVTEVLLFGTRGKGARTKKLGRTQVNYVGTRKREHSRKPDEQYPIIEGCSQGPFLEMFARGSRPGWTVWGNQAIPEYKPTWKTYLHNSSTDVLSVNPQDID
ncbi:MAG TPA: MT-A70 family methyltransferase [Rhizomicrobium sp.]|nr:MT-A70 family methyltransferase [Rhizomicrobium sp.]